MQWPWHVVDSRCHYSGWLYAAWGAAACHPTLSLNLASHALVSLQISPRSPCKHPVDTFQFPAQSVSHRQPGSAKHEGQSLTISCDPPHMHTSRVFSIGLHTDKPHAMLPTLSTFDPPHFHLRHRRVWWSETCAPSCRPPPPAGVPSARTWLRGCCLCWCSGCVPPATRSRCAAVVFVVDFAVLVACCRCCCCQLNGVFCCGCCWYMMC